MESNNGRSPVARVQIGITIVCDVDTYSHAGALMDSIHEALKSRLAEQKGAQFDFTSFNTQPCKAEVMARSYQRDQMMADYPEPAIPSHSF